MANEYAPAEIIKFVNQIFGNVSAKMSSFFVAISLVVFTWWTIKWFLKLLASLAWLITIVFVTMFILPALKDGKFDDVVKVLGHVSLNIFVTFKKIALKAFQKYVDVTEDIF